MGICVSFPGVRRNPIPRYWSAARSAPAGAYALDKNWSIGAEYRYTAYQKGDFGLGGVAAECGNHIGGGYGPGMLQPERDRTLKSLQTQEVSSSLNYQFSSGPLAVKF